jgi:hypothetical protein
VQITPETCTANDERKKEYSVHLVGLELNIYITKMYGTTNIKYTGNLEQEAGEFVHERKYWLRERDELRYLQ